MPKRQKALETATEAVSVPEPKKKKAAERSPVTAKTPAATHKRAAAKTTKKTASEPLAVVMAETESVPAPPTPPAPVTAATPTHEQIAVRAYFHFLNRGGYHGADVEDWCRAERELLLELA
jgi:hypothetical protein